MQEYNRLVAIQATHDVASQYGTLREGAGLLDRSDRGKLDVLGPDAAEYLQGQVTNDIEALAPGTGCYAALLNVKGRVLADLRILVRARDELWLDTERSALEVLRSNLEIYKIGRDVELRDRTGDRAILSLIGPSADELLPGVPDSGHSFIGSELDGAEVLVVRTDLGLDVITAADDRDAVFATLESRGAAEVSEKAAEIVRIESGRPRHGVDMTDANLPAEAGLEERAVSFTKGCYVGQEPVARMHHRGHPNRRLRGLVLSAPVSPGEPVRSGDKEVGSVTSSCLSPALGPIALSIIRREVEAGDPVLVGSSGIRATVVELPFSQEPVREPEP